MALSNIPESDNFDTNVQIPADGDAADASDFLASTIRPLVNRSRWLHTRLNPLWAGGTIAPLGPVVFDLGGGSITFQGDDDYNISLGSGVQLFANGRMAGHMFTPDRTGRANWKPRVAAPSGNQEINPRLRDYYNYTPSANIDVQLAVDADYKPGDHATIVNHASGFQITVKNPAGVTLVILHSRSADHPSWGEVYLDEDGTTWRAGRWFQAS